MKIKKIVSDLMRVAMCFGVCVLFSTTCCINASADTQKKDTMLVVKKAKKGDKTKTVYTIKIDDKVYPIYKGPRGGYFYEINGKRRYLTAKQKQILGL